MQPFITFVEQDVEGEFILQREFPHCVGVLVDILSDDPIAFHPIAGYNIYVEYSGSLKGNFIAIKSILALQELNDTIRHMAEWFLENRILVKPEQFNKFKINASPLQ